MRILITNDDGYQAPGIAALFLAMARFGKVVVVAPHRERSMCSHSIQLREPMVVERVEHAEMGRIWTVEGWPADCVRVALSSLLDFRPDWIVSGINAGANLGVDVFYSGTVAAAREAAVNGIPAIAFSQITQGKTSPDWKSAQRWAEGVFTKLSSLPPPRPALWNVTFPLADGSTSVVPELLGSPVSMEPIPLSYQWEQPIEGGFDPGSKGVLRYVGDYFARPRMPGTDIDAVFSGKIAVTPMHLDPTAHEFLR